MNNVSDATQLLSEFHKELWYCAKSFHSTNYAFRRTIDLGYPREKYDIYSVPSLLTCPMSIISEKGRQLNWLSPRRALLLHMLSRKVSWVIQCKFCNLNN